jgi:glycerol kinase
VPAFTGLGAPHWDPLARGALLGLTRGSGRPQIARAALESMALQTVDLVDAMEADAPPEWKIDTLNVDGGATVNSLLMQIQADLLDRPLLRASQAETTALGAAFLAGIGAGLWRDVDAIPQALAPTRFTPACSPRERRIVIDRWRRAVAAVKEFGRSGSAE